MNVLILVLSARREPWGSLMDCSMETWDSERHPQTITHYYCGKRFEELAYHGVFYSELDESLENVSPRTIEAFEMALKLDYGWDFLARPNSSCYVHKRNLVKFCETLSRENAVYGILTGPPNNFLWGGCQYIFSRDVIEKMVANKDNWNNNVMDDSSISLLVQDCGIPLESNGWCASINLNPSGEHLCLTYNHGKSFTFTDWADVNKLGDHFFVRCKYDPDRTQDLMVFRKLFEYWK